MKNKMLLLISILLLLALPMAYITFTITRTPHNIVPNETDGSEPVPEVPKNMESLRAGGLLGAILYLAGGIVGIVGIFQALQSRSTICTVLGLVLLAGLIVDLVLLKKYFLATVFPLTLLDIVYISAAAKGKHGG